MEGARTEADAVAPERRETGARGLRLAGGAAIGVVLACVIAVWVRAHHAREVHLEGWDARVYVGLARALDEAFRRSAAEGWRALGDTLRSTHNGLYALPLVAGFRVLGASWESYKLLVALLYALPACAVLAGLAGAMATRRRRRAAVLSGAFALTLPALWSSVLACYPDVAALAALAGLLWVGWAARARLPPGALAAMAACAAAAVLLRRHFVFPVAAAYLAVALAHLAAPPPRAAARARLAHLGLGAVRLAASGGAALGVAFLVAPRYTAQFFQGYVQLYEGWRQPPGVLTLRFLGESGLGTTLLALAGLALAEARGLAARGAGRFLCAFAAAWAVAWWFGSGQAGLQYNLHVFPALQAVGLGLGAAALLELPRALPRLAAGAALLAASVRFLLAPWASGAGGAAQLAFGLDLAPARDHAPDLDAYRALIETLRAAAPPGKRIYVAAGSVRLSDAVLRSADELFPPEGARLEFLEAAQVDSRDALPVADLVRADVVVVGLPAQYHLAAEHQRLVGAVVRLMAEGRPFADAFRLERTVGFRGGLRADVYVRRRPTGVAEALALADGLLADLAARPGGQGPWVIVSPVARQASGATSPTSSWLSLEQERGAPARLVSLGRVTGHVQVEGDLRLSACPGLRASAGCLSPDGAETALRSSTLLPTPADRFAQLRADLGAVVDCRVFLSLEADPPGGPGCDVYFRTLALGAIERAARP